MKRGLIIFVYILFIYANPEIIHVMFNWGAVVALIALILYHIIFLF